MSKEDITMLFILALLLGSFWYVLLVLSDGKDGYQPQKCEDAGYIPPRNYHQISQ